MTMTATNTEVVPTWAMTHIMATASIGPIQTTGDTTTDLAAYLVSFRNREPTAHDDLVQF
jgi:hypothetical protein